MIKVILCNNCYIEVTLKQIVKVESFNKNINTENIIAIKKI